jgi:deazaflavin-dependent oxidoreductase (nitroreductase family)
VSEANSAYIPPDLSIFGEEHIRLYLETNGEVGHEWNGASCLILWTIGRKTGEPRVNPVIYGRDGERYVIIASQGGLPNHPGWYHNLVAEPEVELQVGANRFNATATTAEGAERERLWKLMTGIWPNYDEYTKRTTRVIPVVVLEPR